MVFKNLLPLLLLLLSTVCVSAQKRNNVLNQHELTLEEYDLKGSVKYIHGSTVLAPIVYDEFNEPVERPHLISVINFNKIGNLIERGTRKKNRKVVPEITVKYNRDNTISINYLHQDGSISNWIVLKHDVKGNLIEEMHYFPDDEQPNVKPSRRITYLYDEKSNIIKKYTYNEENILRYMHRLTFNEADHLIEDAFIPNDSIQSRTTYSYDEKGNQIERKDFDHQTDKALSRKRISHYDAHGNLTEEIQFDYDGKLLSKKVYAYKYDRKNNWIEKSEYEGKEPIQVLTRKIKYY